MSTPQRPRQDREALVRKGLYLNYATLAYNLVEAAVSLIAGLAAGSVALLSFGLDSCIEVISSAAAQWRLRSDKHGGQRRRDAERYSSIIIGSCFLALGAYVLCDSVISLLHHKRPAESRGGIAILVLSCIIMPVLGRAKQSVAAGLSSEALRSDSRQTDLCAYLSFIALGGLLLNAFMGWWWTDPLAALVMTPIIFKEGVELFEKAKIKIPPMPFYVVAAILVWGGFMFWLFG